VTWKCALLLLVAVACDSPAAPDQGFARPPQTGDGWETALLRDVGMHAVPLLDLLDLIDSTDNHLLHSLLIVKDRKLVFEQYWPGTDLTPENLSPVEREFDRETLHYVASVSKSLTSALVGIAVDRAAIGGVGGSPFSYLPAYAHLRTQANEPITLAHLLSFSSGYDWNEFVYGFDDPRDSHNQMFATADPIGHLLARPVVTPPGSVFHYNSGDTNILGDIVRRATGSETLVEFADRYLFQPLGIDRYEWFRFPLADEVTFASGGASLRPRDMAKLGALYVNRGVWNGRRILSAQWVDASVRQSIPLPHNSGSLYGYGYNWWLGRLQYADRQVEYFRAAGWGGQDVYVVPELHMVVVFTAGAFYENRPLSNRVLIEEYIFEAIDG
jgi:CubicO group peptidase (beta-lactamase class C family)